MILQVIEEFFYQIEKQGHRSNTFRRTLKSKDDILSTLSMGNFLNYDMWLPYHSPLKDPDQQ